MGRGFLFLLLFNVTLLSCSLAANRTLRAEKGILDLSGIDFGGQGSYVLGGEYVFFWKTFVEPDSVQNGIDKNAFVYASVPSYWSNFKEKKFPPKGFGTYFLKIILPSDYKQKVTLDVPVFDAAFQLFVNGDLFAKNGRVGTSKRSEIPEYNPQTFSFLPESDTLEIVVWVSNFNHRRGGFWQQLRLGPSARFEIIKKREVFFANMSFGVILAFSLLFVMFFIGHRRDASMLFFSLVLLGVALRMGVTNSYLLNQFISIPWHALVRLEYLSLNLILGASLYFFAYFLTSPLLKKVAPVLAIICFVLSILDVSLPVDVFSHTMLFFEVLVPLTLLTVIVVSLGDALEGSFVAILNVSGIVLLLFAFANDTLIASSRMSVFNNYIVPYVIMVFAFMHAVIIIYRWVETFNEKTELNNVVNYINSNLEKLVSERTEELKEKNDRFEQQNKEMSKSIDLQNRLFSIIGHDLRSPLATLFQMSEVLEEDIDPEDRKKIIRSLRQLSRSTGDMVDNLIYWGRSQGREITFKPEVGAIRDVYLELSEVLAPIAEQKHIDLQFVEKTNKKKAFFDRELMIIVLRNLINNAIKFTPNGGRVTVMVSFDAKENAHKVAVQDTGVGMSQQMIDRIQKGANNTSTSGTKGEKGTGLGLVLCKDLISLHKGRFLVESTEGEGSRFGFTLPWNSKVEVSVPS